jgi:peptidyl-prolyl cis-trans isomerase A (cyclophilin A)
MIRPLALLVLLCLPLAGCGGAADTPATNAATANAATANAAAHAPPRPAGPEADVVRVVLETEAGPIILALDHEHAPVTTANFLAYVDRGRFDGTTFYRAARTRGAEERGFVQGGIRRNARLMLPRIAHEPTSATGLRHRDGTISMARSDPGTAMGDFFITIGAMPSMDANPSRSGDNQGFAAFGRVEEGMDNVRHILAAPTVANAGAGAMRGQMIERPVRILRAHRAE